MLTAIVLVGRIGARITAELGTMVVSEQIDAFESLGRDPVAILAAPRFIAGVITLPLLVGFADVIGIWAGMVAANIGIDLGNETFIYGARLFWHNWDLVYGLPKRPSSSELQSHSSLFIWVFVHGGEPRVLALARPKR
ncbi:MAG: hypothetical protein CM1200mP14_24720 [Gammaproteobacteria bacterium]|nr:MAG: hypothetical protein CM1200mP14_24720 [Gammaproteobacteria bacterium]